MPSWKSNKSKKVTAFSCGHFLKTWLFLATIFHQFKEVISQTTSNSGSSATLTSEQHVIQKLLGDGNLNLYDHRIRPNGGHNFGKSSGPNSPVYVRVNMYLRTISKVDDVNMEYSLHFTFREEWVDERLEHNSAHLKYINLSPGQKIWMPDTFFQNEKEGRKHDIDTPNILLRIYINDGGRILYSVRTTQWTLRNVLLTWQALYIPSFMLVAVSWVSFWLDKDSVPARVTLGVTTLLTMTTQAGGINSKLPPVSYTKAIDVWIGVCLAFIFGALLEFALVNYAARKDMMQESRKRKLIEQQSMRYRTNPQLVDVEMHEIEREEKKYFAQVYKNSWLLSRLWNVKYRAKAKRIDVLSRFLFPVAFFIFNAVYWAKYLTPYLSVTPHI